MVPVGSRRQERGTTSTGTGTLAVGGKRDERREAVRGTDRQYETRQGEGGRQTPGRGRQRGRQREARQYRQYEWRGNERRGNDTKRQRGSLEGGRTEGRTPARSRTTEAAVAATTWLAAAGRGEALTRRRRDTIARPQ